MYRGPALYQFIDAGCPIRSPVPSPPPTPDALLAPVPPAPPDAEAAAEQRPRGFRQRRTTLPRSTRGWSRGIVWSLIGLTSFSVIYGLIARIELNKYK